MACCLQVENLTKSFGDLVLFENISFAIEDGRRVALVAKNGTGKTTLLNIIAGREDHDGGSVVPRRDLRIAYLEQSPVYPAEMTVLEACFLSENPALKAIAEYERAIEEPSGEGLQEAMARMDALEAWDYEQRAKRILSRLKIRDFGQRVGTLSGGQLKRVALANVLISESDLLILDEPTNHLDTDMTEWLEEYLAASGAGLLMVTHDRYFLDKVCSDILEIEDRQLYHYAGNYSYYLEKKQERETAQAARRESETNLYRRELEWMRRQPPAGGGGDAPPAAGAGDEGPVAHRRLSRAGNAPAIDAQPRRSAARRQGVADRDQDIRSQGGRQTVRRAGAPRQIQLQLHPLRETGDRGRQRLREIDVPQTADGDRTP